MAQSWFPEKNQPEFLIDNCISALESIYAVQYFLIDTRRPMTTTARIHLAVDFCSVAQKNIFKSVAPALAQSEKSYTWCYPSSSRRRERRRTCHLVHTIRFFCNGCIPRFQLAMAYSNSTQKLFLKRISVLEHDVYCDHPLRIRHRNNHKVYHWLRPTAGGGFRSERQRRCACILLARAPFKPMESNSAWISVQQI